MKTSYFSKHGRRKFKGAISIAVGQPKYVVVKTVYGALAPSWNLLQDYRNDNIDEDEYIERFKKQLAKLSPSVVHQDLSRLAGDSEPILLCHCGTEDFCHRHLVAEWLEEKLGIKIPEEEENGITRAEGYLNYPEQLDMFDIIRMRTEDEQDELAKEDE